MNELRRKLRLRRRDALEAELPEEIQTHFKIRAAETGDPKAARERFGHPALVVEEARAAWGGARRASAGS